jgi:hypothetical protein
MANRFFPSRFSWHKQFFCYGYPWHSKYLFYDTRGTQNISVTLPVPRNFSVTVPMAQYNFLSRRTWHKTFYQFYVERADWMCSEAKCARILASTALFVWSLDVVDITAKSLRPGRPNFCGSISRNKFVSSPNGSPPALGRTQVPIRWVLRLCPPGMFI